MLQNEYLNGLHTTILQGRIQFFIEPINNGLPNIIDSFLINLDNLQLGADFTEEMTFTGYHNIAQMSMSFKVECASNYYGPDCTTLCEDNPGVFTCNSIGERVCMSSGYNPEEGCLQCVPNRDPVMNCSSCLPGYSGENCVSGKLIVESSTCSVLTS